MGCFFGCFRINDRNRSHAHLISDTVPSRSREPLVSRNRLSTLLSLEEKSSPGKVEEWNDLQSTYKAVDGDTDDKELKAEAKFLKSCGTLLETPAEIRKLSGKLKVLPHDGDDASSKFHSWLPGTSGKQLNWEEYPGQVPISPTKFHEELGRIPMQENPVSLQHTSSSSPISEGQKQSMMRCTGSPKDRGTEYIETSIGIPIHSNDNNAYPSATPELPIATPQCKKCVRFECNSALNSNTDFLPLRSSPSKREFQSYNLPDSLITDGKVQLLGPMHLPYPTPLKLTDEMQTPGTIYPAKLDNLAGGKNTRLRSQYVYPVLNPIENTSQWNALKEEFDSHQICHPGDSFEQCRDASSESAMTPMRSFRDDVDDTEQNHQGTMPVDASLSHWLKPVYSNDKRLQSRMANSNGKSYSGKSPDEDRPILGTVAAYWNDDEPSHILPKPKWWDGKGIPNSTNKYKEDQKVSWHATPFEERLEKALSDERLFPERNLFAGKPINFDESEESDTAASKFQPHRLESTVQL